MKNSFLIFIFFQALRLIATPSEIKPLQNIPAELAFETKIESPSHLSLCNEELWIFSVSTQQLISIDPNKGNIKKTFPISDNGATPVDIAALACKKNQLYVLINSKPKGKILEVQTKTEDLKITKEYALPSKARASDLFCNIDECWLLLDKPFTSKNLKNWLEIIVPPPQELKKINAHPHLDPFEDWQATLNLANGNYVKGTLDKDHNPALLDPFHTQVVVNVSPENKNISWKKWGSFGAWEGSFLSPKAITYVKENTLAIADSKLKAIFIFQRDGTYVGIITLGTKNIFAPDYPMGLASFGKRLFVSDFRANKIIAVDIKKYESDFKETTNLSIRQNLFRRDEVLKDSPSSLCLNCHDGTVTNQLYKFVKLKFHHPLECSQCHDPHHVVKKPHFLRETPEQLCQSCHKDYANKKTNHSWNSHSKKGGKCTDCHASHTNSPKILIKALPQLCEDCHKELKFTHKSTEDIAILDKAKDVHLENGKINCQTCHQTHINWKESHFIKDSKIVLPFCASCHGDKSPRLFKEFHKAIKTKKDLKK